MATIQNTLSRLHKIAERVNQRRIQLGEAILVATMPQSLDSATAAVQGRDLEQRAQQALEKDLVKHAAYLTAYQAIRNALARANVDHHISAVLAQQTAMRNRASLLQELLDRPDHAVSLTQAASIFEARQAEPANAGIRRSLDVLSVSPISPEQRAALERELDDISRQMVRLDDQLADLNATRITVELDDDIAKEVLGVA